MIIRNIFDFEIGYLAKSPCKDCPRREDIPECIDLCPILEEIQITLARGISCTGPHPFLES